jgi:phosphoribosylglycinamide formyltransferase-1
MNIHPALLPAFPGLHVQKKAVEHGVRIAGCTVHFVNEECDEGPIIIQAAVPVFPDDTDESLSARILEQEHRIYPRAVQLYSEGRLRVVGRKVFVDGLSREEGKVLMHPPFKG